MAALGLLGAPLHPHLPPLIQFPPWWLLVQHGLGCYSLPSSTGDAAFPISVPGGNKDQEGGSQVPDIPLHPASATKMSCSSSKAAGCSLHAPHFIIFLAQAAHPTPGWDFFLHPLAEPAPPTLIPAGSSSSGKSWSFPSRSLGSAVLLPVLYLLLWCPIQAISPHLFHSICSSVLSPEISAPADVLCTLKNI